MNQSVGEVLKELKKLGLDENTFVIYCSDNGPWLRNVIADQRGSAKPLRDGKFSAYEGGVRVPCIMKYPCHVPEIKAFDGASSVIDILPTIAKLADADLSSGPAIV